MGVRARNETPKSQNLLVKFNGLVGARRQGSF